MTVRSRWSSRIPARAAGWSAGSSAGNDAVLADRRIARGRCRPHARARTDPQGHQALQYPGRYRGRRRLVDRIRHRLTSAPRTTIARSAGVDGGDARLHGAGADRPNEPVDRLPQRSLLARRHALPDAHGRAPIHGVRTDGMGALPYRKKAPGPERAVGGHTVPALPDRHEAARQDRRGTLPDRHRPRGRSSALPCRLGAAGKHRTLSARRA